MLLQRRAFYTYGDGSRSSCKRDWKLQWTGNTGWQARSGDRDWCSIRKETGEEEWVSVTGNSDIKQEIRVLRYGNSSMNIENESFTNRKSFAIL